MDTTSIKNAPDLTEKFKEIVKSNAIHDSISQVVINESGLVGENFGSKTQMVTIIFEDAGVKPLNLFVKIMIDTEAYAKLVEDGKLFAKEGTFYTKYLTVARELCKTLGQEHLLSIYPKCYYADNKMMVFENVVLDKGVFLLDKVEQQDFEAATIALSSLAKHHAISRAVVKSMGGSQPFLKNFPTLTFEGYTQDLFRNLMGNIVEKAISRNLDILKKTKAQLPGKAKAMEFLSSKSGKAFDDFVEVAKVTSDDEHLLVLNHGDYWNNNMMFTKDEKTGKLSDLIMFDFQITRYGSPCLDLNYYLFSSVQKNVRRERLHDLLIIYLNAFKKTSKDLNCPTDISLGELFLNFRQKLILGLWMAVMVDNGLGFRALKDIDPEELKNVADFSTKMDTFVYKYLKQNPKECEKVAKEFLDVYEEYTELEITNE